MISPEKIRQKAQKQYKALLRATVLEESFFPFDLPVGSIPRTYPELQASVTKLINHSKAKKGFGYTVRLEPKNTRKFGLQSLPQKIFIENETDYLKLIDQERAFAHFQSDIALIQSTIPELSAWVGRYPLKIVAHHDNWPDLLKVCQYFQKNLKPNLYIRELPIMVHTKFIEENKGIIRSLLEHILPKDTQRSVDRETLTFEQQFSLRYNEPLVRFRILDSALQQKYGFPFADFSLTLSDFQQLQIGTPHCFITENLMSFLTLPMIKSSVAIWGKGHAVSMLKSIDWLKDCSIFYWGDMDVEGFEILAQMRSHFPQTQSILMDAATYEAFADFAVANTKPVVIAPTPLTPAEASLYTHLSTTQKRLEQERITQAYVNQFLQNLYSNR